MKCNKCGYENYDIARFCAYCGNPLIYENEANKKSVFKNLFKRKWVKVVSIVLAVLIPTITVVGVLAATGTFNLYKKLPGRIEFKNFTREDLAFEDNTLFVKKQLLITADKKYNYSDIEKTIIEYGGKIVGCIEFTNDYQIEFEGKDYNYLKTVKEMIKTELNDSVVELHTAYASSGSNLSKSDYSKDYSKADGNWWRSAIHLTDLESKNYDYRNVKVGVFDNVFDTNNPDIGYAMDTNNVLFNDPNKILEIDEKKSPYHGTDVFGFLAAKKNNGIGIDGVANNVDVYGYSYNRSINESEFNRVTTVFTYKYFFAKMIYNGVKIFNISAGYDELQVAAQHGIKEAVNELDNRSRSMSSFYGEFINSGYEFVIIISAGNLNSTKDNTDVDKDNWIRCEITEAHPYGIKQYKKDEDGEIDSLTKLTDDIMYTADYDFLGAITDEEVRNRIIVVGSSTNSNTRADHSVNGQRVDIYAPGENLTELSTGKNGGGTSYATPIVSGVVALMWGINPSLSADRIKYLLTSSATQAINDERYQVLSDSSDVVYTYKYLVNAENAVERARNYNDPLVVPMNDDGALLGYVKMLNDNGGADKLNEKCEISIYSGTEEDAYKALTDSDFNEPVAKIVETDEFGEFSVNLPQGNYYLTASYNNGEYKSTIRPFRIIKGELCYIDDIVLRKNSDLQSENNNQNSENNHESENDKQNTLDDSANTDKEKENSDNNNDKDNEERDSDANQESQNTEDSNSTEEWKDLYVSFLNDIIDGYEFALVQLDEDDIPEIVYTGSAATGTRLAWIHNGTVETKSVGYGDFKYIENEGEFYCQYINNGNMADSVFELSNKVVNEIFMGRITNSVWSVNGEIITQDEYETMLNDAFNFDDAKAISYYSKSMIVDEIMYRY